jgi:hypothetical protein
LLEVRLTEVRRFGEQGFCKIESSVCLYTVEIRILFMVGRAKLGLAKVSPAQESSTVKGSPRFKDGACKKSVALEYRRSEVGAPFERCGEKPSNVVEYCSFELIIVECRVLKRSIALKGGIIEKHEASQIGFVE